MAVATVQISISTTPVAFRPDTSRPMPPSASLLIYNRGTVAVFVGSANVTTTTGFQIDPDQRISIPVGISGEKLYGVTASGTTVCHVFQADSYA